MTGWIHSIWLSGRGRVILRPFSWIYGLGYWARRAWLAAAGYKPALVPGLAVISVGSLSAGGSGKTPTSLAVAGHFLARGRRTFFLSRGYGRKSPGQSLVVEPGFSAELAGDEPLMLKRRCPRAGVIVDRNRVRGAARAAKMGAQVLVLDDGFQQRLFLGRGLDILLLDALDPKEGGLLPAGRLREPLGQGRTTDALIFSGAKNQSQALKALAALPSYLRDKPCFWAAYGPESLWAWPRGGRQSWAGLKGKKVAVFSGIAKPSGFEALVQGLGCRVVAFLRFPDHHAFAQGELEKAFQLAKEQGAQMVLTTEKDAARLEPGFRPALPLKVLRASWKVEPASGFARLLEKAWKERNAKPKA